MKKVAYILIIASILFESVKAQTVDYLQNYTFPASDYRYEFWRDTIIIGENVTNTEPQGKVIVPPGSNTWILGINKPSYNVIIKKGFEIQVGSFFSFGNDYTVGYKNTTKNKLLSLNYEPKILLYGIDEKSLYISPINFATPETGQIKWGIDKYDEGLNFWTSETPWEDGIYKGNWKFYISQNGNIGIGKIPNYKLDVDGDIAISGALFFTSDKKLKSNIQSLKKYSQSIYKLTGKSYIKNNNKNTINSKRQFGLIAQDVIKIIPEVVSNDSSGLMSIDYLSILPVIIETLKEQKNKYNKNLEKINKLKKTINDKLELGNF